MDPLIPNPNDPLIPFETPSNPLNPLFPNPNDYLIPFEQTSPSLSVHQILILYNSMHVTLNAKKNSEPNKYIKRPRPRPTSTPKGVEDSKTERLSSEPRGTKKPSRTNDSFRVDMEALEELQTNELCFKQQRNPRDSRIIGPITGIKIGDIFFCTDHRCLQ